MQREQQERQAFSEVCSPCPSLENAFLSSVQHVDDLSSIPRRILTVQLLPPYNRAREKPSGILACFCGTKTAQREASTVFQKPDEHLERRGHIYRFLSFQDVSQADPRQFL